MEPTFDREQLARYLLGDLPEEQRTLLEQRYLARDELFDELLIVENELADRYADGTLSKADRALIEERWLTDPQRARKVVFAQDLRRFVDGASASNHQARARLQIPYPSSLVPSFILRPLSFILSPVRLLPALAFLALAALTTSGLVWWSSHKGSGTGVESPARPEAGLASAEPSKTPGGQVSQGRTSAAETAPGSSPAVPAAGTPSAGELLPKQGSAGPPKPYPVRPVPSGTGVVAFVLVQGLTRDLGSARDLDVPPGTQTILLRLDVTDDRHETYAAAITTVEGREVWRRDGLRARRDRSGRFVDLRLGVTELPSGDYLVGLQGTNPGQPPEAVSDFYFRLKTPKRP